MFICASVVGRPMAITSEIEEDAQLLDRLKSGFHQIVVLHERATDTSIFCQRFLEERIYITVPLTHPLAGKPSVTFAELSDEKVLVSAGIGFWMDVCHRHFANGNLLVQKNVDALGELADASSLPFFNSDRMIERGFFMPDRVSIPIADEDAHTAYYIACLSSEKKRFGSMFNAVRETVLREG